MICTLLVFISYQSQNALWVICILCLNTVIYFFMSTGTRTVCFCAGGWEGSGWRSGWSNRLLESAPAGCWWKNDAPDAWTTSTTPSTRSSPSDSNSPTAIASKLFPSPQSPWLPHLNSSQIHNHHGYRFWTPLNSIITPATAHGTRSSIITKAAVTELHSVPGSMLQWINKISVTMLTAFELFPTLYSACITLLNSSQFPSHYGNYF